MAGNRIKGITVEIGGDTTKLQTALKGVNTEIRNTQSQLKDVEKLLKLDPGNTELIAQKHRLLAQAVCCTLLPHRSYPLLEHGYQLTAQPMLATSSEGNKISFIDWQPAFSRYQSLEIGRAHV